MKAAASICCYIKPEIFFLFSFINLLNVSDIMVANI